MKHSLLLPWTVLALYITAQMLGSSGWLAEWKREHARRTGNDALMLEALDEQGRSAPTSAAEQMELAEEHLELARRQRQHALALAGRLVAENPTDPGCLILRASAWRESGRLRAALEDLRAARQLWASGENHGFHRVIDFSAVGEEKLDEKIAHAEAELKAPQ